jgi:hypothetical protein
MLAAGALLACAQGACAADSAGALQEQQRRITLLDKYEAVLRPLKPHDMLSIWWDDARTSHICYYFKSYKREGGRHAPALAVEFIPNTTRFNSAVFDGAPTAYKDNRGHGPLYADMSRGCRKGDYVVEPKYP